MISRVDHVAIAVRDYDRAYDFFTRILGAIPCTYSNDNHMKYLWHIFSIGDLSRIELLTPTGDGSFLDNFLKNKEGGVHHITIQTPDIHKAKEILQKNDIPYFGFKDYGAVWKELFIHPKDSFGVLIQIAEFNSDDWISPQVKMPQNMKWSVLKKNTGCSLNLAHPGGGKVTLELNTHEIRKLIKDLEESL